MSGLEGEGVGVKVDLGGRMGMEGWGFVVIMFGWRFWRQAG